MTLRRALYSSQMPKTERKGYYPAIEAADKDGGTRLVWVSINRAKQIASLHGERGVKQLAYSVPEVLKNPTALFRGTRPDQPDWLCYCGKPSRWYVGDSAAQSPFPPNKVLLVFVNDRDEIYTYGLEECDLDDKSLPKDHSETSRFQSRVQL